VSIKKIKNHNFTGEGENKLDQARLYKIKFSLTKFLRFRSAESIIGLLFRFEQTF